MDNATANTAKELRELKAILKRQGLTLRGLLKKVKNQERECDKCHPKSTTKNNRRKR